MTKMATMYPFRMRVANKKPKTKMKLMGTLFGLFGLLNDL